MLLATQQSLLLRARASTSLYLLLKDKELTQAGGQEGPQGQAPLVGSAPTVPRRWNYLGIN